MSPSNPALNPSPFLLTQLSSVQFQTTQVKKSLSELSCTDIDKHNIQYIVCKVARTNWYQLMWMSIDLLNRGKQIEELHPLKFLEQIFSPYCLNLKEEMRRIRSHQEKWKIFKKNFRRSLNKSSNKGHLLPYAEDFAFELSLSFPLVHSFFITKNWADFLEYLLS